MGATVSQPAAMAARGASACPPATNGVSVQHGRRNAAVSGPGRRPYAGQAASRLPREGRAASGDSPAARGVTRAAPPRGKPGACGRSARRPGPHPWLPRPTAGTSDSDRWRPVLQTSKAGGCGSCRGCSDRPGPGILLRQGQNQRGHRHSWAL